MSNASTINNSNSHSSSLLSHSTILILSGFLIGMASSNFTKPGMQLYVFCIGAFGIIAYFALGHVARTRQEKAAEVAAEKATSRMEGRLDRHVSHDTEIRASYAKMKDDNSMNQHMMVTKFNSRFHN